MRLLEADLASAMVSSDY